MRRPTIRDSILPVVLIAAGAVWLLFNFDWIPSFDWVVTLVLVGSGFGILLLEGVNKRSIIGGPLLIALGVMWFLHFHYWVQWRYLAPLLFIIIGLLMLVARMAVIPESRGSGGAALPPPDAPRNE